MEQENLHKRRITIDKVLGVAGARTAYILFAKDCRVRISNNNPNASQREILCVIAREWKKAHQNVKKIYQEKAIADRARYNRELQEAFERDNAARWPG